MADHPTDPHGAYLTRAVTLCPICETRRKRLGGRECFECWREINGAASLPVSPPVLRLTVDHIAEDKPRDKPSPAAIRRCRWPECSHRGVRRGCCRRHERQMLQLGLEDAPPASWPAAWAARTASKAATRGAKRKRTPNHTPCRWPGCSRTAKWGGYCCRDRKRIQTLGADASNPELCAVLWEDRQVANRFLWSEAGKGNAGKARPKRRRAA